MLLPRWRTEPVSLPFSTFRVSRSARGTPKNRVVSSHSPVRFAPGACPNAAAATKTPMHRPIPGTLGEIA